MRSSRDRLLHAHAAHAPDRSGTGCGAYRSRVPGLTDYDGAAPGACQDEDPRWWHSVRGSARARTAAAARRGARSDLRRLWYWLGRYGGGGWERAGGGAGRGRAWGGAFSLYFPREGEERGGSCASLPVH